MVSKGDKRPKDSVKVNRFFLSIGANIGDRLSFIAKAVELLILKGDIIARSSVYESKPMGFSSNNSFLNCCLEYHSDLNAFELLDLIQNIEQILFRRKSNGHYQDRTIDIDILFCNREVIECEELNIPHENLSERNFVLAPLMELAAAYVHPKLGVKVSDLYAANYSKNELRLYA